MKHSNSLLILALLSLTSIAIAAPVDDSSDARILRFDSEKTGLDGYKFGFETSDGISRQEEARLQNAGTDEAAISVRGSVSWVAPDGLNYTLNYVADENGFQPQGAHLPHN